MKLLKTTLLAGLLFSFFAANAQDADVNTGVEKSIFTVQTGTLGFWTSNETRLSNEFALRTEIGIDAYSFIVEDPSGREITDNMMLPSISLEPRWYYNIERRAGKGKQIANNSADFVTLAVEYLSGDMAMSKDVPLKTPEILTFIPKWGMRRSIAGSNFNYELGGGIGYQVYVANSEDMKNDSDVAFDVHLRIGYTF
jgi:hypothetical protein